MRRKNYRNLSEQQGNKPSSSEKISSSHHSKQHDDERNILSDENYLAAVAQGHYILHQGGVIGKHDNVRRLWEDQLRGFILSPHLKELLYELKADGKMLRIADLGAGTGQGFELLTSWICEGSEIPLAKAKTPFLEDIETFEDIEYVGCDLSKAMVDQGNACYSKQPKVAFVEGDLSKGFPLKSEKPFHLYFSSYASFSHVNMHEMEQLLTEIIEHADGTALVVGDWLGRNSIEWPCYWNESRERMLDYSMKWLNLYQKPPTPARHFPVQFWMGNEIREMTNRVASKTKTRIEILALCDVSIFVGRHMDTGLYNPSIRPLRSVINSLHESNLRTDLSQLRVNVQPLPPNREIKDFFESLQHGWNMLAEYCEKRMVGECDPLQIKGWNSFPPILQRGIIAIDHAVNAAANLQMDDPRANIIEPQLGYALRNLEIGLQKGLGAGHSLIGILKIQKP